MALSAGDRIVVYTDGITEVRNEEDEFFERQRLFQLVQDTLDMPLEKAKECVLDSLRMFQGSDRYEDDVTFLLIDIKKFTG